MIAGTLEVQMLANLARLANDMNDAKRMVGGAMSDIEKSVAQAKSVLASLGIGLGVGYFVHLIKGSIDAMDQLQELGKSTNITVETLSGLKVAAKQSGGDLESIALSINKLSVAIGKHPEKFRELGISAKDPLEAFKQLADIYTKLEDPQQRAAVMAAALGKSWAGAAPLLAEGSKRIEEMIERGSRYSGVTTEMSRQSDELNDKWTLLVGSGGLLTRLVGPLLPLLNLLADGMLESADRTREFQSSISPLLEMLKVLLIVASDVNFVFTQMGKDMARAWENVHLIITGQWEKSRELGKLFREDAIKTRAELDAWQKKIMEMGGTGVAGGGRGPSGSDPAAALAAERAARFLAAQEKEKADKEAEARAQQIRDIMHGVLVADDKRALDQVALKNEQQAKAEQTAMEQRLLLREFELEEQTRMNQEAFQIRIATAGQEEEIEMQKHQAIRGMQMGTWALGAELLQSIAGKSRLAAIAVIAINKSLAIAQVIQSTAVAVMRAFADLGPIGGAAAAPGIKALGAIQIGLIAATGLIQASQVGGGGASLGSPANPVNTTASSPMFAREPLPAQIVLNLTVNGHILDTQQFTDTILVPSLRDAIDNRDVTIIGATSRQAANLAEG